MATFRYIFLKAKYQASKGEIESFFQTVNSYFVTSFRMEAFPNSVSLMEQISFPADYHAIIMRCLENDFLLDNPQIQFGLLFRELMIADPCNLWLNHLRNGDFYYGMYSRNDDGKAGRLAQDEILKTLSELCERGIITTDKIAHNHIRLPRIELNEFEFGFSPNFDFESAFFQKIPEAQEKRTSDYLKKLLKTSPDEIVYLYLKNQYIDPFYLNTPYLFNWNLVMKFQPEFIRTLVPALKKWQKHPPEKIKDIIDWCGIDFEGEGEDWLRKEILKLEEIKRG